MGTSKNERQICIQDLFLLTAFPYKDGPKQALVKKDDDDIVAMPRIEATWKEHLVSLNSASDLAQSVSWEASDCNDYSTLEYVAGIGKISPVVRNSGTLCLPVGTLYKVLL